MRRAALILVVSSCVLTLAMEAQAPSRRELRARGYVGVGGGLALPTGDLGDVTKVGWIGQASGGYTSRGGLLGGRLDVTYGQNKLETTGSVKHFGATANLVVTPGRRPADFHPYFLAGGGVYRVSATGGSGETALALNGGAGVQLHLGRQSDVYLEGRFLTIRTDSKANLIPVVFGFRWGGI